MTKSSTRPKGATTYKETAFGILSHSKLLTLELEGIKKGLEMISRLLFQGEGVEITSQLILDIHKQSFGWIFPDWAGKYCTVRVEFSGREAVSPHQIPELISNLCSDLKERLTHINSTT